MVEQINPKEFMSELNADMQREQWLQTARQSAPILGAIIGGILLCSVGFSWWKTHAHEVAEAQTAQLLQWADAPNTAAIADGIIKDSAKWSGERAAIAQLLAASHYRAANQPAKADEILNQLSQSKDKSLLHDFAALNGPADHNMNGLHSRTMQHAAAEAKGWQAYLTATTPAAQNQARAELQKLYKENDLSPAARQRLQRIQD